MTHRRGPLRRVVDRQGETEILECGHRWIAPLPSGPRWRLGRGRVAGVPPPRPAARRRCYRCLTELPAKPLPAVFIVDPDTGLSGRGLGSIQGLLDAYAAKVRREEALANDAPTSEEAS